MKTKRINGDEPATQHDLTTWGGRLAERIDGVEARIGGVEARIDHLEQKINTFKDEIIRHFDVVAENIHQDVAGANRDEISSLKDTDTKLHERVVVIETRLGIPTPPNS